MKKDKAVLIILFITLGVFGFQQYQKRTREFPVRYIGSEAFVSFFDEVKELYDASSVTLTPDMIAGRLRIEMTAVDQISERKLIDKITEEHLNRRIEYVIKRKNSTSEIHLSK